MAKTTGCHYLAGVWTEDLEGLLWYVEPAKDTTRSIVHPTLSAVDHGARVALMPTWSWASVAGPITYPPAREKRCQNELATSVVKIDLKVDATSPYGKVEGGSITLLAVCRKIACFTDITYGRDVSAPRDIVLRWLDAVEDDSTIWREPPQSAGFDEYSKYAQTAFAPPRGIYPYTNKPYKLPESSEQFMAIMIADRHDKTYFLIVEEDKIRHRQWKRIGIAWSDVWDYKDRGRQEVILI